MKLRIDKADGAPVLVLPPRASLRAGEAFVLDHLEWITERKSARPEARPFRDGTVAPFQDTELTIRHMPATRAGTRRVENQLHVSGGAEHINRRVVDWYRAEARRLLGQTAREMAARTGKRIARVRIADQKSRWGSCSSTGTLSFNWRLILAPSDVSEFVVAHEVAHMQQMNHGPAFHRLVAQLHDNPVVADRWLHDHGADLRAWGQIPT